jgi:hypothetical protein
MRVIIAKPKRRIGEKKDRPQPVKKTWGNE